MVPESGLNPAENTPPSLLSSPPKLLPPPPAAVASSEWNDEAVFCLLDNYCHKFSVARGYLRNTDWEGVVAAVNQVPGSSGAKLSKTMKQCRDKIDSLKRRYKIEKRKAIEGGLGLISWPYFQHLDHLMGSVAALKQPLILPLPLSNPPFHPNSNPDYCPLANLPQPIQCLTNHPAGGSGASVGGGGLDGGASGSSGSGSGARGSGKLVNFIGLSSNNRRSPIIHNSNHNNNEDNYDDDDGEGEHDAIKHSLESSRSPNHTFRHGHAQSFHDHTIGGANRYNNKPNPIPSVPTTDDDDDDDDGFAAVVYPNRHRIHHHNKRESSPPPGPTNGYPSQPNGGASMGTRGDRHHHNHHHHGGGGIPNMVKKRKAQQLSPHPRPCPHPVHNLANAITGFAQIFAHIELAKLEIFAKMELEMAKLSKRKSRRSHRKRRRVSTSSTGTFGTR